MAWRRTSRGNLSKNHQVCRYLIYSWTSLNDYLVFATQVQRYCIRMSQSVVSKINLIHALYQHLSKSTLSMRQGWPFQSQPQFRSVLLKCIRMACGILAWNIATSAGLEWTAAWHTTDMGDPTIVYGIITWAVYGPYLFTALLKVSYQVITSQGNWLSD